MIFPLKNVELNYPNLEKQSFTLIKPVHKFFHYILRSKVYAIVLDPIVKLLLMKNELGERRGKWMVILQEFYLEIQPMKLVRGQGLTKMIVENEEQIMVSQVYTNENLIKDVWYQDIVFYLL